VLTLIWRERALEQLEAILAYIAERNEAAARRLQAAIDACAEGLTDRPFMYRPGRVEGTREAVVRPNYIVIYRVTADAVEIGRGACAAGISLSVAAEARGGNWQEPQESHTEAPFQNPIQAAPSAGSGQGWRQGHRAGDHRRAAQGRYREVLRRRYFAKKEAPREAKGGEEANAGVWVGEHSSGGVYRGVADGEK
jgi:toxin ParE1/3/4